ncbi:MAG: hypothetical protein II948_07890 [Synergistaceae bacterium]|nr:hypothetical protein [Synergistaceae bacterium]MBR0045105.1 hypothetical protein [Synergistaceae bacterium]
MVSKSCKIYLLDLPLLGTAKLGKADRKEEWLAIVVYHYSSSITACFIVLFNLGLRACALVHEELQN